MLGYYDYTVLLTYISLSSAILGIIHCFEGNIFLSILCLLISGFCDMFDGKVARTKKMRTKDEKNFGVQIDSLSDVIAFGVLPATIGYNIGVQGYGIAVLIFFVLAALIRLAYFNVLEANKKEGDPKGYIGLPVTSAALVFPLVYSLRIYLGKNFAIVYGIVLGLLGLFFLLKFKLKKPGMKAILVMIAIGILELVMLMKWN